MQERPVQQQRDRRIDARLQQIERQEHCAQQRDDLGAGNAHVQRRDQIVPQQHTNGHCCDSADKAERGTVDIAAFFVDQRGGAGKGCTRNDVHDHADQTCRADEQLQHAGDDTAGECGKRAVEEACECQENVLRFIAQEADDRHLDKQHGDIADGTQQCEDGQLSDGGCVLRTGHRYGSSGFFHGDRSFLT